MKPNETTHYQTHVCENRYNTETLEFTVNQGPEGAKQKVSIRLHDAPTEDEFPGGAEWCDDDGKQVKNPFYMAWLKYTKDHEIASQRRDGVTVFHTLWRPIPAERGEMVRKPATVAKEIEAAMERDSEGMMHAMALRLAARKGIEYAEALAKVKEDWA